MPKIRFLAGASCPSCKSVDSLKITLFTPEESQSDVIICVNCGYTDQRPDEASIKTGKTYDDDGISIVQLK